MAKKGKKNNSSRKKKSVVKKGGGSSKVANFMSQSVLTRAMQVCSITNPFCPEANGARWPDNSFTKSVGWSVPGQPYDVNTAAGGQAEVLFLPEFSTTTCVGTSFSGAVATMAAASTAAFTYPTTASRYRITSWGVSISTAQARLSAAGMLRIRLFSPLGGATLNSIDMATMYADASLDVPISRLVNEDIFVISNPIGENARIFRDVSLVSQTMATWVNPGWQCISVGITGGGTSISGAITVRMFYNFELVYVDGDSSTAFARRSPPEDPIVEKAAGGVMESVGNFLEGTANVVDKVFKSKAVRMIAAAGMSYASKSPAPLMLENGSRVLD